MKKLVLIATAIIGQFSTTGQVTKNVIVEHFTNTYCGVCASRNPGFYTNRAQFPQVIHIAYHPSSPYPACPLNQHNKQENDARTNYYGVYGSTPRLVIQGKVISSGANYADASIFQAELGQTSAFETGVTISPSGSNGATVSVKVKKVSASALSSLQLYAALAEDTIFLNAANGETKHYDVFRKSVWGAPMSIPAPANIGDSVLYTQTITLNSVWTANRIYVIAMLQDQNNEIVQVAKSSNLKGVTSISLNAQHTQPFIYPNPTKGFITVNIKEPAIIRLFNQIGEVVKCFKQDNLSGNYNISALPAGIYCVEITENKAKRYQNLVKE